MGKAKAKGKRATLTHKNDDPATGGEDEKTLAQKRKSRHQKPFIDDEDVEKIEEQEDAADDDGDDNSISDLNEKKRKRNKEAKEKDNNLVKKESPNGTRRSNGFRQIGSRRKNKPHRAAEVGVECK
uniref:DEAD-box ATP-dependent RNA helicase 18-like n=1 Tax=Erigeron canadensis TaxID=72917 RepID=UPI001CB95827|nr:DEAD-box ATP-dependent RNA helicase 18-like [Erigeron canadensis]